MFEQGAELKARHGADNVYDFSLGNPDLDPPSVFHETLRRLTAEPTPGAHRYMANAGYRATRTAIASRVVADHGVDPTADGVVVCLGAAGALNVLMKSLLDPGSEVVLLSPYFAEYPFYVDNHGGRAVVVPTTPEFLIDHDAVAAVLGPATRAILVNSPNNPSGRIYDQAALDRLADIVQERAPEATIVSDEPYRRIVYDGAQPGTVLRSAERSVVVTSYSKDLSLAGERLGYLAVHPNHPNRSELLAAAIFTNRTLGFVNAPALMQRVIAEIAGESIDVSPYAERRKLFLDGLRDAGYDCVEPEGAFYLFPKTPIDDVAFVGKLLEHRILAVPGTGFGTPGHMRLSYAVDIGVIERSLPGFREARRQ